MKHDDWDNNDKHHHCIPPPPTTITTITTNNNHLCDPLQDHCYGTSNTFVIVFVIIIPVISPTPQTSLSPTPPSLLSTVTRTKTARVYYIWTSTDQAVGGGRGDPGVTLNISLTFVDTNVQKYISSILSLCTFQGSSFRRSIGSKMLNKIIYIKLFSKYIFWGNIFENITISVKG